MPQPSPAGTIAEGIVITADAISFVNCLLSAVLLIATIISVACAFRAYKHQKLRAKKDTACNLARYYSEDIIRRYGFVNYVLTSSGLSQRIKDLFPYDDIKNLDHQELLASLKKSNVSFADIDKELSLIDPQYIYQGKILMATSVEERHSLAEEYTILKKEDESVSVHIAHGDLLQYEFNHDVVLLLNNLEWFAMSCQYGLADEKMLYQSLHQTFLSHIWLLYFYICKQNTCNENKLFTNIIWLFNLWKTRLRDIQKEALKSRAIAEREFEEAQKRRSAAESEAENARKKMDAAQPNIYTGNPLK